MRILFIDDNVYASELSKALWGHRVDVVNNLSDAKYRITEDPGAAAYGVAILDLDMPIIDLPKEYQREAIEHGRLAGWTFYQFILSKYPELQKHTILFTAFERQLKELIGKDEFEKLCILDKKSERLIATANRLIKEIAQ